MEDLKSKITFSGIKPPHATSRVIERQIQKWIDREQSLLFLSNRASYTAHIDREDYRFYTCHIEIRIGSREWSGLEEGRSVHEAVQNTLKNMRFRDNPTLLLNGTPQARVARSARQESSISAAPRIDGRGHLTVETTNPFLKVQEPIF